MTMAINLVRNVMNQVDVVLKYGKPEWFEQFYNSLKQTFDESGVEQRFDKWLCENDTPTMLKLRELQALEVARSQDFPLPPGAQAPVFIQADILDTAQPFPFGPFDWVLSNPPYIMEAEKAQMRRNVLDFEPSTALFVPDTDPLVFYRAVAAWCGRLLVPGGRGLVEINESLGVDTAEVFASAGFGDVRQMKDFFDKDRFVSFRKPPF